jgi:hypothetical protein
VHVVFSVHLVHAPGIKEDQGDEYVDRPLLGKPESQLETAYSYRIQLIDQENTKAE